MVTLAEKLRVNTPGLMDALTPSTTTPWDADRRRQYEEYKEKIDKEAYEQWKKDCYPRLRRGYSSLEEKDWGITFDTLNPDPHIMMGMGWTPKMGKGIFLYGEPGRGKSTLGKALINRWANEKYRALFITLNDALDNIKHAFDDKTTSVEAELDKLRRPELLFLDDVGSEKTTEFTEDKFFAIINYRMEHKKHTWISTNLTIEAFKKRYGFRIFDRILSLCSFVECKGSSYRQQQFFNEV